MEETTYNRLMAEAKAEYEQAMADQKLKKTAWTKRPKEVDLAVFLKQYSNKPKGGAE